MRRKEEQRLLVYPRHFLLGSTTYSLLLTPYFSYFSLFILVFWLLLAFPACGQHSDTIVSIALHPTKPNIIYVATDEAVYKSNDAGTTWTRFAGELARTRVISLAIDPTLSATVFAGTMGDGTYKTPDGGRTWHQFNAGIQKGTISSVVNQVIFNPLGTEQSPPPCGAVAAVGGREPRLLVRCEECVGAAFWRTQARRLRAGGGARAAIPQRHCQA